MQNIRRLFSYLQDSKKLLVIVLGLALLSQGALLLLPKLAQQIIRITLQQNPSGVLPWAGLILVLTAFKAVFSAGETYLGARLGQRILFNLRQDIYSQLIRMRLSFFDQHRSGELLSRVTADLEPVEGFFSWGSRLIFRESVLFIGIVIFALTINVQLTLISLGILPLISITAFYLGNLIRPTWQRAREEVGAFTSNLEETLSGIRVVKMTTQEKREIDKLTRASKSVRDKTWLSNRIDATYYPITGFWGSIAQLMVLSVGGVYVINGQLTLDEYVAFEFYMMMLIVPMRMLGWMVSGVQRTAVAAGRIFSLMEEPQEKLGGVVYRPTAPIIADQEKAEAVAEQLRGEITFDHVTFGYRPDEPVLCDLSLEIKAGETVGVLGPTGSGKSALLALIPRLYDPQQGRLLIDGIDARDYELRQLRRQTGFVFQEPFLFSGTIKENISFGRPEATQEEVEEAAKLASLHDFIVGLDNGYETLIGERGLNLSGGQQQRMSLARTLLMNPRILILDDYTSSVDAYTEFHIQQALLEYMPGRTTFVISQRASSVAVADRIIVIDEGRIIEQGRPEELANLPNGQYRRLLEVQKALGVSGIGADLGAKKLEK